MENLGSFIYYISPWVIYLIIVKSQLWCGASGCFFLLDSRKFRDYCNSKFHARAVSAAEAARLFRRKYLAIACDFVNPQGGVEQAAERSILKYLVDWAIAQHPALLK